MDIFIKGVDAPENCWRCPCINPEQGICMADKDKRSVTGDIPKWCGVVSIPKHHGDLVDSKRLMEGAIELDWSNFKWVNEITISNATIANTSEE